MNIKTFIKNVLKSNRLTNTILLKYINLRMGHRYRNMKRTDIFSDIYKNNAWGDDGTDYYSGEGSRELKYIEPYCNLVIDFVKKHNIKKIVDLGCGDYYVAGKMISQLPADYIGIDIYQDMIDHHNKHFSKENVSFMCRDIVNEDLPDAELCLIRQVLQHLSNEDISKVLSNVKKYKYVIVTEHRMIKGKAVGYNVDMKTCSGNRVHIKSGVYLEEKPFDMNVEELLSLPYDSVENTEIKTMLIRN